MMPGLAFRFRAFISVIGWSTLSLILATNFSPEARKLVPRPSCSPSAAARNEDWSGLVVGHDKLCEEGGGSSPPGWIKDKEITLPILLNFVSNHRPRMSHMLEDHRHILCDSHRPTQRIVYGPSASLVRRKVVRNPSHHLLGSGVCPAVRRTAVRITQGTHLFDRSGSLLAHTWIFVSDGNQLSWGEDLRNTA